jgi:hypothetical protein
MISALAQSVPLGHALPGLLGDRVELLGGHAPAGMISTTSARRLISTATGCLLSR